MIAPATCNSERVNAGDNVKYDFTKTALYRCCDLLIKLQRIFEAKESINLRFAVDHFNSTGWTSIQPFLATVNKCKSRFCHCICKQEK